MGVDTGPVLDAVGETVAAARAAWSALDGKGVAPSHVITEIDRRLDALPLMRGR